MWAPDSLWICLFFSPQKKVDTKYDWAKGPPYNGSDPLPSPGSLKALLFPPLVNEVQNKGTQGVQARYDAELPPFISIVWQPGQSYWAWKKGRIHKKGEFINRLAGDK